MSENLDRVKELLGNRRAKALVVAVAILMTVVVLQVGNLKNQKPMCELLTDCKLRTIDLHRMQIALGKSGLCEFEIQDNKIMVPQANHAAYLQAIADQKAIPPELRSGDHVSSVPNPFLSRSQQQLLERETKKRQIQEMVVRLPFVEQAWFEMDAVEKRPAFGKSTKSAVISIRPTEASIFLEQHVDTVRQMIAGAIAGIDASEIVVIDLSTGFAHRHAENSEPLDRRVEAQRVAFVRQQYLENRIHQSLSHYPELRITVIVETVVETDQLAGQANSQINPPESVPATISAGANGQASIYEIPEAKEPGKTIRLTAAETEVSRQEHVGVVIDVPQTLLAKIYGNPAALARQSSAGDRHATGEQIDAQFAQFKTEIEQIVRPLLGSAPQSKINFNLIRQSVPSTNQLLQRIQGFAEQNWPSIAVLLIGMVLIYLVTHSEKSATTTIEAAERNVEADILSINSASTREADERKRDAEVRLSQLIDKNPDAAAKVIQDWIRDAA